MMRKLVIFIAAVMTLTMLLGCSPAANEQAQIPPATPPPQTTPTATTSSPDRSHLTPNPVETSMPVYGGTLLTGYWIPASFDGHQKVALGPIATLPVFNQLVMFDINYKETVPENIIGDLAESWETSDDGLAITFKLHQGVKWHDGVPFTADDVIYSLDKMVDVNRSAIADWFPAYQNTEKIDDNTVKVNLKYPSAGFMLALAQGESQIQALHLAGTDHQAKEFMVGTGPFILTDYLPQIHLKFKRNPDYFKKDKYGNQLPYLDSINYFHLSLVTAREMLVARRLDILGAATGASILSSYQFMKEGAPELLWQKKERYQGTVIILNLKNKPLDDVRVRRAMGLVLVPEDLIIGFSGDVMFGMPGAGILHPGFGLPKNEVAKLMGWDKPYEERVAEAHRLMAEAGYPEGFKLDMMSPEAGAQAATGATLVFAEALRQHLKIETVVSSGFGVIETQKRIDTGNYGTYTRALEVFDPFQLGISFGTGGYSNYSNYSNPELDKILANLDYILDPDERREAVWAIERILLTDLPVLPTGLFVPTYMPYYPHVKNMRYTYILYSNISRFEDVWLDESLRVK